MSEPLTPTELEEFKERANRIPWEHCIFTGHEMKRVLDERDALERLIGSLTVKTSGSTGMVWVEGTLPGRFGKIDALAAPSDPTTVTTREANGKAPVR